MGKPKGSLELAAVILLISAILFTVYGAVNWTEHGIKTIVVAINSFKSSTADKVSQEIKYDFVKPSMLYALMDTTNKLSNKGAINTDDFINDAENVMNGKDIAYRVNNNINPPLQIDSEEPISYWAVVDQLSVDKRFPFVYYGDLSSMKIGTQEVTIADVSEYGNIIEQLRYGWGSRGEKRFYNLHMLIQVFMTKEGKLKVEVCQSTCTEIKTISGLEIKEEGMYEFIIGHGLIEEGSVKVKLTGYNTEDVVDDVVIVKELAVSIYDSDVVKSGNTLLTESLNAYTNNYNFYERNDIKTELKGVKAVFIPSEENIVYGLSWEDYGINTQFEDGPQTMSRGLIEENIEVRYQKLYDLGVDIINSEHLENIITALDVNVYDELYYRFQRCGGICYEPPCSQVYSMLVVNVNLKGVVESAIKNEVNKAMSEIGTDLSGEVKIETQTITLENGDIEIKWELLGNSFKEVGVWGGFKKVSSWQHDRVGGKCVDEEGKERILAICWSKCEYYYGGEYTIRFTIRDKRYKVFENGEWRDLEFKFNYGGVALDRQITRYKASISS